MQRSVNQTTADWDTLALTAHRDAQLGALRWQVPPCLGFRFHKCDCTNLVCFDLVAADWIGPIKGAIADTLHMAKEEGAGK
jgi:hypothetical protein